MATPRKRTKHCTVVIDLTGTECGKIAVGKESARGLGIEAHIDVCGQHKAILSSKAANLRLAGKK